jgi:hypothetical protein
MNRSMMLLAIAPFAFALAGCTHRPPGTTLTGATVALEGTPALPVQASEKGIVIPVGIAAQVKIAVSKSGGAFEDKISVEGQDSSIFDANLLSGSAPGTYDYLVYGVTEGTTSLVIVPVNTINDDTTPINDGQVSIPVTVSPQK